MATGRINQTVGQENTTLRPALGAFRPRALLTWSPQMLGDRGSITPFLPHCPGRAGSRAHQ